MRCLDLAAAPGRPVGNSGSLIRPRRAQRLRTELDPEKWEPVFGKVLLELDNETPEGEGQWNRIRVGLDLWSHMWREPMRLAKTFFAAGLLAAATTLPA